MKQLVITSRKFLDFFDRSIDWLTTYRTVLYLLIIYLLAATFFSLSGRIGFTPFSIIASAATLVVVCHYSNRLFARLFNVPANHDSDLVTALILSLIMTPAKDLNGLLLLAIVGVAAMLSKYVITVRNRHIFNPAAFGAFLSGLVLHHYASWWIGTAVMGPLVLIGGLVILRKMKRFQMVLLFSLVYIGYQLIFHSATSHAVYMDVFVAPFLFFASVMLTEPLTSPFEFKPSLVYAALAGVLFAVISLHLSPEEALLIANLAAFVLEPDRRLLLSFIGSRQEAEGIYSYLFKKPGHFAFAAGQYMEWTLPGVPADSRGNRRYLTVSSSPTEDKLMFTAKLHPHKSKFKDRLESLKPNEKILTTRLQGDFVLPKDKKQKLAFIAGGVGITPFRSMVKYMADNKDERDGFLLYSVNSAEEIAFKDLFDASLPVKYVTTKGSEPQFLHGFIDSKLIKQNVPEFSQRTFYISGPQGFVAAVRLALIVLEIPAHQIITDYFPGYS